jgi:hypothetical protein
MYSYICNDKEFHFPESWEEVNLKTYIKIAKLEESKSDYKWGELYLLKLIEVLSSAEEGDLDDLSIDQINELSPRLLFIKENPNLSNEKSFYIEDKLYASPEDFKTLSIGEFISIKTYHEAFPNVWDACPWILAILWRPAEKVMDEERGVEVIKRESFKTENLEFRKNLFLSQPATKIIQSLLFFSTSKGGFMSNIGDFIRKEKNSQMEDPAKSA